MPGVRVRENEYFDAALRRFKRACEKAGVLTELRRREFYEKPTQERKRKKAAAVKRHAKRMQREAVPAQAPLLITAFPPRRPPPVSVEEPASSDDMKQAMRAGDKARLGVVRMALAAIQQREVDERIELDDAGVLGDHREDDQAAPRVGRASTAPAAGRTWRTRKSAEIEILAGLPARAAGRSRAGSASWWTRWSAEHRRHLPARTWAR